MLFNVGQCSLRNDLADVILLPDKYSAYRFGNSVRLNSSIEQMLFCDKINVFKVLGIVRICGISLISLYAVVKVYQPRFTFCN